MNNPSQSGRPWHLWVVGLVSLLWNAGGGASDYVLTKMGNADYLQMAADTVGMEVSVVEAYFEAFPLWMNIFWAIGVWAAVLGSILLLLRSGFAFYAFIISLIGICVSTYYQVSNPFPGEVISDIPTIMAVVVPVITLGLIYYSWRMAKSGVLR